MTKQRIATHERVQPSAREHSKRTRAASILLFSWLLFWVVGIVQPCCAALASSHYDDHAIRQTVSLENTEVSAAAHAHSHEDEQCPQAITADSAVLGDAFILPAKVAFQKYGMVQAMPLSTLDPLRLPTLD